MNRQATKTPKACYAVWGQDDGIIYATTSMYKAIDAAIDYNRFSEPDANYRKEIAAMIRKELQDYSSFITCVGNADIHIFSE